MKKHLIGSLLLVMLMTLIGIYIIDWMTKQRVEENIDFLLKRAVYTSNRIKNYVDTFPEEIEFYIHENRYVDVLNSETVDPSLYWDLKRLFNKYKHLIVEIEISNSSYKRKIANDGQERFVVSKQEPNYQVLDENRSRNQKQNIIHLVYPIRKNSMVIANIKFTIDLDRYIKHELSTESLDKATWVFFIQEERLLNTISFSERYSEESQFELVNLSDLIRNHKYTFATHPSLILQSETKSTKLILSYYSFSILKTDFGIAYAVERSKALWGIRYVSIVLSVLFTLIIIVVLNAFRKLIRHIRNEELNLTRIQKAVDNANDLILITSTDSHLIFANQAFYHLCDEQTAKSKNPLERLIPDGTVMNTLLSALRDNKVWNGELDLRIRQGLSIPCLLRSNVILDMGGAIIGYLFIATDISERKRSDRMKNEFISTVSHELRTPLTSIRGSLGLIKGGVSGELPAHAKKLIDIAYSNSERLIRLINDILDIEKIEAGAMEFHLCKVQLLPEIEKSIRLMSSYAEQYNVSIVLHNGLADVEAIIDPDRFEQVMNNLLSNACKFSVSGSVVEIEMKLLSDKNIRLLIRDYGMGIPEEFRAMMFKKFAQVDSSDTRAKGGTGLGLSITKAIIEKFGGTIDYESEVNKGTTFIINLPVYRLPKMPVLEANSAIKQKILIIEDDVDIATLIHIVLRNAGYDADIAYSAEDAKIKLEHNTYALISLDLLLPKQQGISLTQELRANPSYADIPIVVVSAVADQKQNELHGGFGIVDWIPKPIDMERLQRAIMETMRGKHTSSRKVLYIEDDQDLIHILNELLKGKAELVSANTLRDGMYRLDNEQYDLLLLDINLPDGSGLDIIPYKQNTMNKTTPVLIFSAFDTPLDLSKDIAGALVKSKTTNDDLVAIIQEIISKT